MGRRTGEPLTVSKDGRSATYEFKRSGFTHRLVAVPNHPEKPLTLAVSIAGRPVDPSMIQAGEGVRLSGPRWTFRATDLMKPKTPATKAIRIWYQPGSASPRSDTLDPKLREELRALGYLK
jgi:hypothetical protein